LSYIESHTVAQKSYQIIKKIVLNRIKARK